MAIPQRALNLSLAAMRQLNSALGRLTTLRKAIVVGIAVAAVMVCSSILNQGKPDAADNNVFTMFCIMLVLLVWGLYRLCGLVAIWVVLAGPAAYFAFGLIFFMPDLVAVTQVRIERNKVRIGMTINEVLPLVHGMDIRARAVLPDSKNDDILYDEILFDPSTTDLRLVQLDGTFQCTCGEQVSRNLTESQAAELMKQRMSDGYEWRWRYRLLNGSVRPSFTVTFGRDGRVNHITNVYTTDIRFHPM